MCNLERCLNDLCLFSACCSHHLVHFLSSTSTFCSLPLKYVHQTLSYKEKQIHWNELCLFFIEMKYSRENQQYFFPPLSPPISLHIPKVKNIVYSFEQIRQYFCVSKILFQLSFTFQYYTVLKLHLLSHHHPLLSVQPINICFQREHRLITDCGGGSTWTLWELRQFFTGQFSVQNMN